MRRRARRARAWLASAVLLGAALGCGQDASAPTQIELTVESDLNVPGEIDRVSIAVGGMVTEKPAVADLREQPLPRHLTLLHRGGPTGPVIVTATGLHGRTVVVERVVALSFETGETVRATIALQRACVAVDCEPGATCDDGDCRAIDDGSPAARADAGPDDGGLDDGGRDGGGRDGGMDAGKDAGSDGGRDAGGDAAQDGGQDAGDAGPAVNEPPVCTIIEPEAGAALMAGLTVHFSGGCTDPETSRAIASGLRWTSSVDGALGSGAAVDAQLDTAGAHLIRLCAPDPRDSALVGCAMLDVSVALPDPPTVSIDSVKQGASSTPPFNTSPAIALSGSATGQMVSFVWRDTFVGQFATTAQASLAMPQIGRHRVTLVATDNVGQRAEASREFVVLANNASQLVQPFATANTTFATAGGARADALARDSADHVLVALPSAPLPAIYVITGGNVNAGPTLALTAPTLPDQVRAITIAENDGHVHLATKNGLTVCGYAANTGLDSGACTTFKNGQFPSNDTQAVARTRADGDEYLVVGTSSGLLSTTTVAGSNNGSKRLDGSDVSGLAAGGGIVWVATRGDGLFSYDPARDEAQEHDGAPSDQLTAVAVDQLGLVWVGGGDGLGRYQPEQDQWLLLRADQSPDPGLPSDTIRCLATTRVMIGTTPHDVVWVGTSAGVTRIDTTLGTLMNLTMADGLPSASVRAIVVLADGSKVIATDAGLARYQGL